MEHSRFEHLPAEIRNNIYRYAVHEPSTVRFCISSDRRLAVIRSDSSCPGRDQPPSNCCRPPLAVALFAVCSMIRHEALGIYFGINPITIYARRDLAKTLDMFWAWMLTLDKCQQRLVRRPPLVTIWLGNLGPFWCPNWHRIRYAAGTFQWDVPVRLVIGFNKEERDLYYPESYEKFSDIEFTMFYSHLRDADRKLNWIKREFMEDQSYSMDDKCAVRYNLALLGDFSGRMPTFRRRGDIGENLDVGLPNDLDSEYGPELFEKCSRYNEGLQLYDFVPEWSLPRDFFYVKPDSSVECKQEAAEHLKQAIDMAVQRAIEEVLEQERGPMTKRAARQAVQEGTEKATERIKHTILLELSRTRVRSAPSR